MGEVAGSGHIETIMMLHSTNSLGVDFLIMKYLATLASIASTIPGGLFMPSISIGAGIGAEATQFYTQISPQIIIIISMITYLSAVIRIPLSATFAVLEMTLSFQLVIPALTVAFIANFISKKVHSQPIYAGLAEHYLKISKPSSQQH